MSITSKYSGGINIVILAFRMVFPFLSGMVLDLSFQSFVGVLEGPTINIPERVLDTIRTLPKNGKLPCLGWEPVDHTGVSRAETTSFN